MGRTKDKVDETAKKVDLEPLRFYTEDELREVNKFVVYLIRQKQLVSSIHAAAEFCIGEKVYFSINRGRFTGQTFHGEITRINAKTIHVHTDGGMNWKVAPTFLRHDT